MVAAAAAAADRVGAALEESLELQELRLGFRVQSSLDCSI